MICYGGFGETPSLPGDGFRRRRMTVLNGVLVESRKNPFRMKRRIPMFDFVLNPIAGRWRGVSPAQAARFKQSFLDALLMGLGAAIVRASSPPFLLKQGSGINEDDLLAFRWDRPLRSTHDLDRVLKQIPYAPPIQPTMELYAMLTQQIRRQSAASDPVQGLGFGSKRMSATETQFLGRQSLTRPEMTSAFLELDKLPALGKGLWELNRQFLTSPEDIAERVPAKLADAATLENLHTDRDLRFVGSRKMQTKQMRLQALMQILNVVGSIPGAAPKFPFEEVFVEILETLDLKKLEGFVGNPARAEEFVENTIRQIGAGNVSANRPTTSAAATDLRIPPAQAMGEESAVA